MLSFPAVMGMIKVLFKQFNYLNVQRSILIRGFRPRLNPLTTSWYKGGEHLIPSMSASISLSDVAAGVITGLLTGGITGSSLTGIVGGAINAKLDPKALPPAKVSENQKEFAFAFDMKKKLVNPKQMFSDRTG